MLDYNDHHHIIRTTAQWQDRSIANVVIERGTLCIELAPGGKTKIKIGEGNKYYRQLPYVGDGSDLSNYYTKEEIDQLFDTLNRMAVASTIEYETYGRLPLKNNKLGDVRFVKNTSSTDPLVYLWNGSKWIPFSSLIDIDLSEYAKKSEVNPRLDSLEEKAHTHPNKSILDDTTASYTEAEQQKLESIEITDVNQNDDGDIVVTKTSGSQTVIPIPDEYELPIASASRLGGVRIGTGLEINSTGVVSVTGGGGSEVSYTAGDGISITPGEETREITQLSWVQGSIDTHGVDDDTVTSTIRSPFIESGLTDMINLSATDTSDVELKWKIFYYDSNHDFISGTTTWSTRSDYVQKPLGCAYIRIVLTRNAIDPILPSDLGYCELSYPIEIGKYVISNTGVTHIELDEHQSVQTIENGNTNKLFTFSDEFTVDQQNNVSITDFHRLILNVSE